MTDRCQQYLEDPESHAAHLAECAKCRTMADALSQNLDLRVRVDAMPLAPWEGASHRNWPLVIGVGLAVIAIAAAFFAAAGTTPLKIAGMNMPSADVLMSLARLTSGAIQNAPTSWQIGIAISFVVVNALFILLLRRAPRGIDV